MSLNNSVNTIIFIGIQGSGKGTQTELLKKYLTEEKKQGILHIETGHALREMLKEPGYASERIAEIQAMGHLQPVFVPVYVWSQRLMKELKEDLNLLVDGSPRSIVEAEIFESAMSFFDRKQVLVFNLELGEADAINRLKNRGRSDDNEEAIKNRIEMFHRHTEPILDFLADNPRYKIIKIDASRAIEEIHRDIISYI